jgi:hypothetical protein
VIGRDEPQKEEGSPIGQHDAFARKTTFEQKDVFGSPDGLRVE